MFQHPGPSATGDTWFRLGWAGMWHRPCMKFLVLPFTDHPLLWSPEGPFLSQLISPLWWAFSEFWGPPSIFSFLSGLLVPVLIVCFNFFILPDYEWIFLVLLGVQRPPLLFTKYSVENYSISRCILGIYIWVCVCVKKDKFHNLLFYQLDFSSLL